MNHTISSNAGVTEVTITGRLTFSEQAEFRQVIKDLDASTDSRWLIDIQKIEYLDSAGLGLLLRAKASADKAGKQISLRPAQSGQVSEMMEISHFHQLFDFV